MTPGQFIVAFPEFANIATAKIQSWIDRAQPFFNPQRWDDLLCDGVMYWVAHSLQLAMANADQPLTDDTSSQTAGPVSYQRDSKLLNAEADNPYLKTAYGQQYLYYQRMVGAGAIAL